MSSTELVSRWIRISFDELEFLREAVRTPSHESVDGFREMIFQVLEDHEIEAEVDSSGNLIASKGSGRPHLVLNSHMDTVSPHVEFREDEEKIYGRGSCDAKGPLASMLKAFVEADMGEGRLSLALTPDEETESRAIGELGLDPDAVVVGEPTGLDACNASRGRFEVEIKVEGENAHAAEPESGVNAVSEASKIINLLKNFDSGSSDEELGRPTLTPTIVSGGKSSNVVPDTCKVRIDRRSVPGESMEEFMERLEMFIRNIDTPAEVSVDRAANNSPLLGAFRTSEDSELVNELEEHADGELRPFTAVCEASYFAPEIPTAVFGPGVLKDGEGGVAHSKREYVEKEEVKKAGKTAVSVAESFLS
ncbi:MAG: M20 family metallopeptidase [Candidatus Nanohalobium sp.]